MATAPIIWFGWWLVWNIFMFRYIEKNNSNWRTHIFQRGRSTTSQIFYPDDVKPIKIKYDTIYIYIILYYIILYYIISYYIILYNILLYYITLYYITLYYIICFILYYIILFYISYFILYQPLLYMYIYYDSGTNPSTIGSRWASRGRDGAAAACSRPGWGGRSYRQRSKEGKNVM